MLHHVSLEVPQADIERSIEFWSKLGFDQVTAPDAIAGYVTWLERDDNQVHFIHTPEPTVPSLGHPAVVAPDFDATVERLRSAGFEVHEAQELWGQPRAFAVMPGGQKVELMAAPPGAG
jgi:catechol 2,3-dioxygenase-like lactoylglutathione lyase family enzyme